MGHFAHTKDDTFLGTIVKDIKVHGEDLLSKLTAASHKNIVTFQQALYHNNVIYIFYEVLDVSLAQTFATPLGQLRAYEIAAFCCEILTGIKYIHKKLKIVHGDINTENILLSTDGSVKIGITLYRCLLSF